MAYTPELSQSGSATLRRLAWFLGKPMTHSLEMLVETTARRLPPKNSQAGLQQMQGQQHLRKLPVLQAGKDS